MKIIHTPADILQSIATPVGKIDKKTRELVAEMIKTLGRQKDPEGVGLAAPQVDVGKRIFITRPDSQTPYQEFINPVILRLENSKKTGTKKAKSKRVKLEGCLSIPRIWGEVERHDRVHLQWQDKDGKINTQWFEGFIATIIQHEIDHLDGVLFTRRVLEQQNQLYKEENGELTEYEI